MLGIEGGRDQAQGGFCGEKHKVEVQPQRLSSETQHVAHQHSFLG